MENDSERNGNKHPLVNASIHPIPQADQSINAADDEFPLDNFWPYLRLSPQVCALNCIKKYTKNCNKCLEEFHKTIPPSTASPGLIRVTSTIRAKLTIFAGKASTSLTSV